MRNLKFLRSMMDHPMPAGGGRQSTTSFAVALMAGGRSSRMGRDKARLEDGDGREWWRGRLELLWSAAAGGAGWSGETLISCREDQDFFVAEGARRVCDVWPGAGPLGGIVGCLEAMKSDLLLVMAVDMPLMNREVLTALLVGAADGSGRGAVFCRNGFFEPLAAVYPKNMAAAGRRRVEAGQGAMKDWILESADRMNVLELPEKWVPAFRNVNDPGEWRDWMEQSRRPGEHGDPD